MQVRLLDTLENFLVILTVLLQPAIKLRYVKYIKTSTKEFTQLFAKILCKHIIDFNNTFVKFSQSSN